MYVFFLDSLSVKPLDEGYMVRISTIYCFRQLTVLSYSTVWKQDGFLNSSTPVNIKHKGLFCNIRLFPKDLRK